jgi:hypothetical protein
VGWNITGNSLVMISGNLASVSVVVLNLFLCSRSSVLLTKASCYLVSIPHSPIRLPLRRRSFLLADC